MIKNERQYRITKAQIEKFSNALAQLSASSQQDQSVHPILRKAERESLESQLTELRVQVEEYEALKEGQQAVLELDSLEALPHALIKARIAAGLTQKDLAERLRIKEQQVQRYEDTEYASASFARLVEVSRAIGIQMREEILLPKASLADLISRLKREVGLDQDLLFQRFLPPLHTADSQTDDSSVDNITLSLSTTLRRVFGWTLGDLFSTKPLQLDLTPLGSARYKVPARVNEKRMSAYTIYAHVLAVLVLDATVDLSRQPIPVNHAQVREAIFSQYGSLTFESALRYVWSLGIPVLPLRDSGAFHGACWRIAGRNIIVLKQPTDFSARWLFDLLHEQYHAGQEPELSDRAILEADITSEERRESEEEIEASQHAADVVLNGRAYELVEMCIEASKGSVEKLKRIVPQIAKKENVPVDFLANYLAFCLPLIDESLNWWGAANNLQVQGDNPWQVARDVLLEHTDFERLNEIDRGILLRALSDNPN